MARDDADVPEGIGSATPSAGLARSVQQFLRVLESAWNSTSPPDWPSLVLDGATIIDWAGRGQHAEWMVGKPLAAVCGTLQNGLYCTLVVESSVPLGHDLVYVAGRIYVRGEADDSRLEILSTLVLSAASGTQNWKISVLDLRGCRAASSV